ncbi:hypothetical protein N0V87_010697 [Didymella glomerata]|uniref:J domain-containing protein n=1 Tax=Didymella glomerata TaxID=749621 RepID=A0A9W8WNU3_9PLEO|nr:hypothetical protein N0V87_010697 [Didymella glomerata]
MSSANPPNALPAPDQNAAMNNAGSTAGQQTTADAAASQPPDDSGDSDNEEILDYTPEEKEKERQEEIIRILRWPDWAYYEILDVRENASTREIIKAYRKKSLLTHTDRNRDREAEEVFKSKQYFQKPQKMLTSKPLGVQKARDILGDENERRTHDSDRAVRKERGELVQNDLGEGWAQNAHDNENDDDNDDDTEDDGLKPASQAKRKIFDEMRPLVERMFESDDETAFKSLGELNQKMKEQNKSERERLTDHTLPLPQIRRTGRSLREQQNILRRSDRSSVEERDATARLEYLQETWVGIIKDFGLPVDWNNYVPITARPSAARQERGAANGRTGDGPTAAGSAADQTSDAMDTTYDWVPGETIKGDKILAHRTVTVTRRRKRDGVLEDFIQSILFVIEKKGARNPIELADEGRVGLPAVEAYLALPADQKCELARVNKKYSSEDRYRFGRIKGVARSSPGQGKALSFTVVLIEYKGEGMDRSEDVLINRSTLQEAQRQKHADASINDFLVSVGQEPDILLQERRLMWSNQRLLGEGPGSGRPPYRAHVPQMLGDRGEVYHPLSVNSGVGMPPESQQRSQRDGYNRRDQSGARSGDTTWDAPRNARRQASPRLPGPTPVRTDTAPVQQAPHTNANAAVAATPPNVARGEQRRPDAGEHDLGAIRSEIAALTALVTRLVLTQNENPQGSQNPIAAGR